MTIGNFANARCLAISKDVFDSIYLSLISNKSRPMFKEVKKSTETRIILDCAFDKIESVLRQADEIGMITDYHAYMITSLVSKPIFVRAKG